jgi:hypothetical protein
VTYNGLGQPTSGSGTTETSPPPALSTGKATLFTVDGFQYTVAAGPFSKSIGSGTTTAAPGSVYWDLTVIVHNVQTDRDAPLSPAYSGIFSVGVNVPCPNPQATCSGVGLEAVAPAMTADYFSPGQTIQIQYESGWTLPQTMNPSSIKWIFATDTGPADCCPTGPQLDIPPS